MRREYLPRIAGAALSLGAIADNTFANEQHYERPYQKTSNVSTSIPEERYTDLKFLCCVAIFGGLYAMGKFYQALGDDNDDGGEDFGIW